LVQIYWFQNVPSTFNLRRYATDPNLPGSHVDYSTTVIFANVGGQLACGLFLIFFGCLGDFGNMRYKGLVLGWVLFSALPIVVTAVTATSLYWLTATLAACTTVGLRVALHDAHWPALYREPMTCDFVSSSSNRCRCLWCRPSRTVSHLSAQQMYDAYLPLLAKSHWRGCVQAVTLSLKAAGFNPRA
jgi:hypothetical protein